MATPSTGGWRGGWAVPRSASTVSTGINSGATLQSGVLVANPVPAELALDPAVAEAAIVQALQEADSQGVRGKDTTPFLLARVKALTGGESLKTNVALIEHNARLAARVAVALLA